MSQVVFLDAIRECDSMNVGGKGAALGTLIHAGISVPSGFVVTAEVFDAFSNSHIPDALAEQILAAFDQLGSPRVAVRSSATAEDGMLASWAGQLETFLNVSRENLIEHIDGVGDHSTLNVFGSIGSKRVWNM